MTYPQPAASEFVKNGGEFWRLNTLLASPGDIYESDESLLALAVGPDSDLSRVSISYYDKSVPASLTNSMIISPDRSFVGQIAARPDQPYPLTGLHGRVLVSPAELYDPAYRPPSGTLAFDVVNFVTPRLDVIGYFQNVPSVIPQRSDGDFYTELYQRPTVAGPTLAWSFVVVPYYGRKYGDFAILNNSAQSVDVQLLGIDYTTNSSALVQAIPTTLLATAAVAVAAQRDYQIRASVDGMFDAIVIGVRGSVNPQTLGPIYTTLRTSDDAL